MAKTVLNVKTDADVKREAQNMARDIGVPLSTIVNAYLKEFIRARGVQLTAEPRLRPHIAKLFEQAKREPLAGKNSRRFGSMQGALSYLNKQTRGDRA